MSSLSNLSRNQLQALAVLRKRGIDVSPYLARIELVSVSGSGSGDNPANSIDPTGQGQGVSAELTPDQEAKEYALCGHSFEYFCANYGYVLEPRPPTSAAKTSFEEYLNNLPPFDQLLTSEQLSLLPQEMQELEVSGGEIHFALWDFQIRMGHWVNWLLSTGQSGAVEKSRDMGATWTALYFVLWCWLFRKDFTCLLGSKKADDVDNGLTNSLFGKLDYAIEKLPAWLKPDGYSRQKHRRSMSIQNPTNGSFLVGDTSNEDFGRSGRYTMVLKDEEAFCQYDTSGSVSHLTKTALYISSVKGQNHFWRLVERFRAISEELVLTLKYDLNPFHTPAWFADQQAKVDEFTFASEVLIDYKAAIRGKYYPIANLVRLEVNIAWKRAWPSVVSWDYGVRDDTALIWWQRDPATQQHRMMYSYFNNGKPIDFYFPFARAEYPPEEIEVRDREGYVLLGPDGKPVMQPNPFEYTAQDIAFIDKLRAAGVRRNIAHRGDPAGRNRSGDTATSIEQKLARAGIEVSSNTKENDYKSRRASLTSVLMNCVVNVEELYPAKSETALPVAIGGAYEAFDAIRQAKFPDKREGSQSTSLTAGPVHDWTSHYRSSAEYYAVGEQPVGHDQYRVLDLTSESGITPEGLNFGFEGDWEEEGYTDPAPDYKPDITEKTPDPPEPKTKRKKWVSSSKFIWVEE